MANKMEAQKLVGNESRLLAEGCKIRKQIDELTVQLKATQEKLSHLKPGKYENAAGDSLTIAETATYSPIPPATLLRHLKNIGKANKFKELVTVKKSALGAVIPSDVYEKWEKVVSKSTRWTWKK